MRGCARADRCDHVSPWSGAVAVAASSGCEPGWRVWSRAFGCAMRREVEQARYTGSVPEGRRLVASGKARIRAGQAGCALRAAYRPALRAAVAASAAPYGYTLTIWTSGAVLSHARGIPSAADALLFMAGAVVAYALVGGLALGGSRSDSHPSRLMP